MENKGDNTNPKYHKIIDCLEKKRIRFEKTEASKFESKIEILNSALDDIYRHFRQEVGYRPAWLINAIEHELSDKGRPSTYSHDERVLNSQFIDILVKSGSSQAQAINLLGYLRGHRAITEGFKKEVRETYKEFISGEDYKSPNSILEIGLIIAQTTNFNISQTNQATENIENALIALRSICSDFIGYLKSNHDLIKNNDPDHHLQHPKTIIILESNFEDAISYFYQHPPKSELYHQQLRRELSDYLNSIELFNSIKK